MVIGDPCSDPTKIPDQAPEVVCSNGASSPGKLIAPKSSSTSGAFYSDHGYVIIGMIHDDVIGGKTDFWTEEVGATDDACTDRSAAGYQSGMGTIFREVAKISLTQIGPADSHPAAASGSAGQMTAPTPASAATTNVATATTIATPNAKCAGVITSEQVEEIESLVALHPVVLFGVKGVRCTLAAEAALDARGACYHTRYFEDTDPIYDYFKCLYPGETVGSTPMHSYVFIGGQPVGNGFRLLLDASDSRCTSPGGMPCLSS